MIATPQQFAIPTTRHPLGIVPNTGMLRFDHARMVLPIRDFSNAGELHLVEMTEMGDLTENSVYMPFAKFLTEIKRVSSGAFHNVMRSFYESIDPELARAFLDDLYEGYAFGQNILFENPANKPATKNQSAVKLFTSLLDNRSKKIPFHTVYPRNIWQFATMAPEYETAA